MSKRPFVSDGKPTRKIFINNVREALSLEELTKVFLTYGEGEICQFSRQNNSAGKSNGKCIEISYRDPEDENRLLDDRAALSEKYGFDFEVIGCCTVTFKSPIEKLNDDCLFMIFQYLSQSERIGIERVCKKWRAISLLLWTQDKTLDFKDDFSMRPFQISYLRHLLLRSGNFITDLDFSCIGEIPPKQTFHIINTYCRNLTCLDFSNISLQRDDLEVITVTIAEKLELIHLDSCELTDEMLSPLLVKAKNLEELSVFNNPISGISLLNLTNKCVSLSAGNDPTNLKYGWVTRNRVEIDCYTVEKILEKIPNAAFLKFYGSALGPDILQPFSRNLIQLWLHSNDEFFKSSSYKKLTFPVLEELNLSNISKEFINPILLQLPVMCPAVKALDLTLLGRGASHVSDLAFKSVLSLQNLRTLCLNSTEITCETFEYIAVNSGGRFENIECKNCSCLNDEAICRMIECSPKLRNLMVTCGSPVELNFFRSALDIVNLRSKDVPLTIFAEVLYYRSSDLPDYYCGIFNKAIEFARQIRSHPLLRILFNSFVNDNDVYEDCNDCELIDLFSYWSGEEEEEDEDYDEEEEELNGDDEEDDDWFAKAFEKNNDEEESQEEKKVISDDTNSLVQNSDK